MSGTTNSVNAASVNTTAMPANKSKRAYPSDEVLKKLAKEMKVSVKELKGMIKMSEVPSNRKSIYGLVDNNKMDMKVFCQLNGIEYSKWRDYKAKDKEVFYILAMPDNTTAKSTTVKSDTKPAEAPKQKTKPQQNQQPEKTSNMKNPTSENRTKYGSDFTHKELAEMIYSKSKEYYGAVGKPDFDALLGQVNKKNASAVIKEYQKVAKESLIDTLASEYKSDKGKRKDAIRKVYLALAQEKGTSVSVQKGFEKELESQFNSFGTVSTTKLDETMNRMMASPEELALKMKNDIHGKWGAVGNDSFDELLLFVTPKNAQQVIKAYDDLKTGESLLKGISREVNSSKSARKSAMIHIYTMLAAQKSAPEDKKAEFEQELNKQFNSWGFVNTDKLDKIVSSIIEEQADNLTKQSTSDTQQINDIPGGNKEVILGNGKILTANSLRKDAIISAKKDEGFKDVVNPYIVRPLPNVNATGKIEAVSEVYLPTNKNGVMRGKVVIVNAGHGGYSPKNGYFDSGTVLSVSNAQGKKMPIEEWRVAGDYTKDLTEKLQAKGATVVVVSGPVSKQSGGMAADKYLENMIEGKRGSNDVRKLFKNAKKSDIAFVSIHVESVKDKPDAKACTVRANNDSGDQKLAQKIQQHVGKNIYALKPAIATNDYYVTRAMGPEIPAVLLELGNIANDKIAASLLSSNDRGKYTNAIADALEETLLKQ